MTTTNSTHTFTGTLPGIATAPPSRGSPRGCSEGALKGAAQRRRLT
jgi:hypothetical protein